MTRGMFSVGGLKFGDLVETLQARFQTSIAQAATLAETAQSTFYRVAADRQYQAIEREVPGQELKYVYGGPDDKLTRPYCEDMLARTRKRALTREEISKYPNGQLLDPFISGGGWRCRHVYWLDARAWEAARSA
jgi:hypothetical protein